MFGLFNKSKGYQYDSTHKICVVNSELSEKDVKELLDLDIRTLQFRNNHNITEKTWKRLNELYFKVKKETTLRLYGYEKSWTDLGFLKYLEEVEDFSVEEYELKDIAEITNFKKLRSFAIGETKLKSVSLKPLEKYKETLEELYIEGNKKDLELISEFTNIRELLLRSITNTNIGFISSLQHLEYLRILLGGIKDFTVLKKLKNLKYLELWMVRGLGDLNFISEIESLETLFLQALKQVKALPSFKGNKNLKKIKLMEMNGLENIQSIQEAEYLEELFIYAIKNKDLDSYKFINQMKSLKNIKVLFGNKKKNEGFLQMLENKDLIHDESQSNYLYK